MEVVTADVGMVVFGALVFTLVLAVDGWEPRSTRGWFATKFTWLSGGRG